MNTPHESAAIQHFKPLCGPLHDALQHGLERADRMIRNEGLTGPQHAFHRHNHARLIASEYLHRHQEDFSPWALLPTQPTGSLQVARSDATLRVLRPLDGGPPAPGRNRARRSYYVQPPLTGLTLDAAATEIEASRFIATWEMVDSESFEVAIRVYRTTGTFRIGAHSRADLAFWLPNDAARLDELTFEPTDEGIELPIVVEESGDEPLRG